MGFREKMAQLKQRATDFGGDAVSKWKRASERSNQQYYGTSPLQQAMHQQRAGNMTPEASAMMRHTMQSDPAEMHRQAKLMELGRHGDYGRGNVNTKNLPYAPSNEDHTTKLNKPLSEDGKDVVVGPVIEEKLIEDAGGGASTSELVKEGNTEALADKDTLDKIMNMDPSKLNADGRKMMQKLLNNLGYKDNEGNMLDIDGKVGPLTSQAMANYNKSLGEGGPEGPLPDLKMISTPDGLKSPHILYENTPSEYSSWDSPNPPFGPARNYAGYWDQQHDSGISNPANDDTPFGAQTLGQDSYGEAYNNVFLGKEEFMPPKKN
jgi:hypothetical protein